MGSGGKGRTENRWDVSGAGQPAPTEVYLKFQSTYIKKSATGCQSDNRSILGDTAECCSVSEISI